MMNTDKAYIFGLVVGGGCFSSNQEKFYIKLPYKQWGDVQKNPRRAGVIARDILNVVAPVMRTEYGLNVTYVTQPEWRIECVGSIDKLVEDLQQYGITASSEVRKNADISGIVAALADDNMKKRFIAGIADTIGSMAPSQRRFSDDVQIISFEINGFAFHFVCQLCNLLYSVGCIPDQILWQHPNMQSGTDAYYRQWKKGNKLRVALDTFSSFGALGFKSKAVAAEENKAKQRRTNSAEPCEEKAIIPKLTARHVDEDYSDLPEDIRGGHYIHHKQFCAVLNCPHAPFEGVACALERAEQYVMPFTVLHKGKKAEVSGIIAADPLLSNREYRRIKLNISMLIQAVKQKKETVQFHQQGGPIYSEVRDNGYPLKQMMDAIAYIIASQTGNLNGNRVKGSRDDIIDDAIKTNPDETVDVLVPELLTPVIVTDDTAAAMVGPLNSRVYKKLISFDPKNKYKMILRPITEADLVE